MFTNTELRKLSYAMAIPTRRLLEEFGPVYDDVRISPNSLKASGTKSPGWVQFMDDGSSSVGVYTWAFDDATEEELWFEIQMPHGVQLGSTVHPHIHWAPMANGTAGDVVSWAMEYTWVDVLGTFGNTTIISANAHIGGEATLVAKKHYITPLPDIDAQSDANQAVSSVMLGRIYRDATGGLQTDDLAQDAALLSVDFHVKMDTHGSIQEYSK